VQAVLEGLWHDRPDDDDYDWIVGFISLTQQIWGLSTCRNAEWMEDFAVGDGTNTGHPVFATETGVLEFHEAYDAGDGSPFAIHLWTELRQPAAP
jgi:hypothetical protein